MDTIKFILFRQINKIKYFLFKYGIHKLLPYSKLYFWSHFFILSKWISDNNRNISYSMFPSKKYLYDKRYSLYQYIIDTEIQNIEIDYFEFGVANGKSFEWWLDNIKNKNASFFGFDTFTGLPENWGYFFRKGDMSCHNILPTINDTRHQFIQGLFQETLLTFLKSHKINKKKIIHLDADLYSSTLFVLTTISSYLKKGDIIIFDEFNVPLGEFKAFKDWIESYYIKYSVIGEVNNFHQIAIKLI
ncbi:class I SAM-dependent methyltransferase (plasmid) [Flammeovirga sp. MY04]|uniref:class I SAM-dependent methyltransferase n=1 Tax=Flammeovirga sp. MY04 TaxID=1191459 RepID=UPI001305356F|nr:class I SAM-dependent methyltransferase [Flammeovirga sp. MY04]ANQ52938.2 class I SAM-dependent methyltransferase [Flammeovirga sp. MY04]